MAHILAADDQPEVLQSISAALSGTHEVSTASDGRQCLDQLNEVQPDCILLDLQMPEMNGIEVLETLAERNSSIPVVMLTATRDVKLAVKAMKAGAFDYLTKPADLEELRLTVARAIEQSDLKKEVTRLRGELGKVYGLPNVVGKHPSMQKVYQRVKMVAPRRSSVLIFGESGTGKELIARAIHLESPLKDKPFVPVNCAAIPDSLIEDEFFGHEKGAFTDARSAREGCFEQANGGTLFLDEIGELSQASQAKLLRVLQEKEFKRVGGARSIAVEVRLIAATNRDLKEMVETGEFRQDLYYRVHVVPIQIPALRKRRTDIPLLLAHFLKKIAKRERIPPKKIDPEAMKILVGHRWSGNVRELENTAEQLMALTLSDTVTAEDLPASLGGATETEWPAQDLVLQGQLTLPDAVERFEQSTLQKALELCDGNKTQTAELLGLTRRVLGYKLKAQNNDAE
jgi:DNA-binding NtrC family response regulator